MPAYRWFLSSTLSTILVGGLWLLFRSTPVPAEDARVAPAAEKTDPQISSLSRQLDELREEQNTLLDDVDLLASAVEEKTITEEPPVVERGPDPVISQVTRIEGRMASEHTDPDWAPQAEATLAAAWQRELPVPTRILSTSCAGTVCRLEMEMDTRHDDPAAAHALGAPAPWASETVATIEGEDPANVVLYISREGYGLDGKPEPRG